MGMHGRLDEAHQGGEGFSSERFEDPRPGVWGRLVRNRCRQNPLFRTSSEGLPNNETALRPLFLSSPFKDSTPHNFDLGKETREQKTKISLGYQLKISKRANSVHLTFYIWHNSPVV